MKETDHTVYETKRDERDFSKLKTIPHYETRIWHERREDGAYTGRTYAVIWDGDKRHVGIAQCAEDDQFSRKRGRQIAVGRANAMLRGRAGQLRYSLTFDPKRMPISKLPASLFMNPPYPTTAGEWK